MALDWETASTALAGANVALGSALGIKDKLWGLFKKESNSEAAMLMADLSVQMAEVKMKLAVAMEENAKLRIELQHREDAKKIRAALKHEGKYYRLSQPYESFEAGRYCARCFDEDGSLCRIDDRTDHVIHCRVCHHQVYRNKGH